MMFISKKKLLNKLYEDLKRIDKSITCDEKFIKLEESRDKEFGTNVVETSEVMYGTKIGLQRSKREKEYLEDLIKLIKES